jgi:hypothetical protein
MGVKILLLIILVLGAIYLVSFVYGDEKPVEQGKPAVYILDEAEYEPETITFVVEETGSESWYEQTEEIRSDINRARYLNEEEEDLEKFEAKSKLSNVRRIVDGEIVIGYDEGLDDLRWKEVE